MNLGVELAVHVKRTAAGAVFAAETGFKLATNPDTVRAPDVAFIAEDRLPSGDTRGYPALAPDLVVEVLSPDDRPGEVLAKVGDWLSAGCRLVWVVDPERRVARVYRHDGSETIVSGTGPSMARMSFPASAARSRRFSESGGEVKRRRDKAAA